MPFPEQRARLLASSTLPRQRCGERRRRDRLSKHLIINTTQAGCTESAPCVYGVGAEHVRRGLRMRTLPVPSTAAACGQRACRGFQWERAHGEGGCPRPLPGRACPNKKPAGTLPACGGQRPGGDVRHRASGSEACTQRSYAPGRWYFSVFPGAESDGGTASLETARRRLGLSLITKRSSAPLRMSS